MEISPRELAVSPADWFDHIYVLTLKRAVERQKRFAQRFSHLEYEFFFGKEFSEIDPSEYDRVKARRWAPYRREITSEEISCSFNHRRIYEDMIKKGYRQVLILEDDAVQLPKCNLYLESVMNELPADWELLYLDYWASTRRSGLIGSIKHHKYWLKVRLKYLGFTDKMIENFFSKKFSPFLEKAGRHMLANAYAITRSGALKLIELQTPVIFIADCLLAYAAGNEIVNAFISVPKLFKQEGLDTYIQFKK